MKKFVEIPDVIYQTMQFTLRDIVLIWIIGFGDFELCLSTTLHTSHSKMRRYVQYVVSSANIWRVKAILNTWRGQTLFENKGLLWRELDWYPGQI